MSNPTSNFNWQMPTNTDLVTDLPADFEVFGQAVDTSMADLKGGTTGQILSKTTNADMDFTWITNDVGDITAVTATSPLTGGGTSGAITVGIQDATTSVKGSVQLSDSTSTTSSVLAATPTAVKSAYDLAASAYAPAFTNNFYAGKNKIINGDFGIWQRGTSFSANAYTADRWYTASDATVTTTQQTFTPATAPVSGYEGTYYLRQAKSAGGSYSQLQYRAEDVRLYANQATVLSFWAKADSAVTLAPYCTQNFGSGGSTQVDTALSTVAITTSWVRYSITFTPPSISGKTIGTSSYVQLTPTRISTASAVTIDIWGVQWESGSTATPFQTATGTKQGELAACQRYLPAISGASNSVLGYAYSTTGSQIYIKFPTTARVAATGITVNGTLAANYALVNQGFTSGTPTAIAFNSSGTDYGTINITTTAAAPTLVAGQIAQFQTLTANGYVLFTGCEL